MNLFNQQQIDYLSGQLRVAAAARIALQANQANAYSGKYDPYLIQALKLESEIAIDLLNLLTKQRQDQTATTH